MKIHELEKRLVDIGVSNEYYSILTGGLPSGRLCIVNEPAWEVYHSERGRKFGIKHFKDEDSACDYFFEKLKKYGTLPE